MQIRWHPYQLNPNAPKGSVDKRKYYEQKFGSDMSAKMANRMSEVFAIILYINYVNLTLSPWYMLNVLYAMHSLCCFDNLQIFRSHGLEYDLSGLTYV